MPLTITTRGDIFEALWDRSQDFNEQKAQLKSAGFWFHGGGCYKNCKACAAGLPLKRWCRPPSL